MEGGPVFGIHFIMRGLVKVVTSGLNGKEQIVRFGTDGDILGHRGYKGESYPVSSIAMERSEICFINNEDLYHLFMQNAEFTYHMMNFYAMELKNSEARMKYLAQMNVREKVAEALLFLIHRFGVRPNDNALNMALSRQEIANIAGTTNEQVIRQISSFEKEKILIKQKRDIKVLNSFKLKEIVKDFNLHYPEGLRANGTS